MLQERLSSLAGIKPVLPWLDACRSHLRQNSLQDNEDEVLHQILHTDLRNVVRNANVNVDGISGNAGLHQRKQPSVILRQAITNSTSVSPSSSSSSNKKVTLPPDFRCMLQVEELLDVSLNAEERLSKGPASNTSPTPIGNQNKRCLKLLLSDGYFEDGSAFCSSHDTSSSHNNNNNNNGNGSLKIQNFVAMETAPIPNLSVQSKPGIKIILSGPISIFVGVLMLNPSNTTVLGGCIPSLIPIQQKALSCAAKVAGVGIDPTYRALVWNPDTGMDDENDEGEQASSDVQQPQPTTTTTSNTISYQQQQQHQQNQNHTNNFSNALQRSSAPIQSNNHQISTRPPISSSSSSSSQHQTNNQSFSNSSSNVSSHSNSFGRGVVNHGNNANINVRSVTPVVQSASSSAMYNGGTNKTLPSTTATAATPSSSSSMPTTSNKNTFRVPNVYSSSSSTTSSSHQTRPLQKTLIRPSSSNTTASSQSSTSVARTPSETSSTSKVPEPTIVSMRVPSNNTSSLKNKSNSNEEIISSDIRSTTKLSKQSQSITLDQSNAPISNKAINNTRINNLSNKTTVPLSPTALSEPLSFTEFRNLLNQIIHDAELYEQYTTKTFVVPCKLNSKQGCNGTKFNVEKRKNYKKSKGKSKSKSDKYGYVMECLITGPNESDGAISCKLSDECIRPFLSISAVEMRKLASEDKAKANKIANECGANIISDLRNLSSCELKLIYGKDEFFDGKEKAPFHQKQRCIDSEVSVVCMIARSTTNRSKS